MRILTPLLFVFCASVVQAQNAVNAPTAPIPTSLGTVSGTAAEDILPIASGAYYKHAILTPSSVQGQVFEGAMRTNAGISQVTLLPAFYHNASATDAWYKPSSAFVIGGTSGGGSASAVIGPMIDAGPQLISGIEGAAGLISPAAKTNIVSFFSCSPLANACGTISVAVLFNANLEQGGKFSTTLKEVGEHPLGFVLGPSVTFK